jgi:glycosyltransferase involved in cell wall biosynthesis
MEISVIVPNYNGMKYLKQCLSSLLSQDFEGVYEVIIIDDCSTDDSRAIIETFCDNKFVFIQNYKNSGQAKTRNVGLDHAKGKYICFVDSDDFVSHEFLQCMYNSISKNERDMSICNYEAVDCNNNIISQEVSEIDDLPLYAQLLDARCSAVVWDKIYRRDLIEKHNVRFMPNICNEDILFNFDYMINIETFSLVDKFVISYRQHSSSMTKTFNLKTILDMNKVFSSISETIKTSDIIKKDKLLINAQACFFIYYILIIGFKRSCLLPTKKEFFIAIKEIISVTPNIVTLKSILNCRYNRKRKLFALIMLFISKISRFKHVY